MRGWQVGLVLLACVLSVTAAIVWGVLPSRTSSRGCAGPPASPWLVTDGTPRLGGTFAPGAIQSFGSNGSAVWMGGVGSYNSSKDRAFSSPLLVRLGGPPGGPPANLTGEIEPYFHNGGLFVPAWNGTGWLLVGQAGWGENGTEGAVVYWHAGTVVNLSAAFLPYFSGRGIYIAAWNGSAWLIGGNSTSGASLVSYSRGVVTDLTPLLHRPNVHGWVQMLGWNGTAWMVGGYGILASYSAGRMTNLWPQAPFAGGGVYGLDWNGGTWLVSGSPTRLAFWDGTRFTAGPALPASFDAWVNVVVAADGGWVLAGAGRSSSGGLGPQLAWLAPGSSGGVTDLSADLPGAFEGGQVQFGGLVTGSTTSPMVLLVGQGAVTTPTQMSHGAVAVLTLGCG